MERKTDWNRYYSQPYKTAHLSRKVTEMTLLRLLRKFVITGEKPISIAELGGGNSCFYEAIKREIKPKEYLIVDNNELALRTFKERYKDADISLINRDVLSLDLDLKVDLVFSVGLIEHFSMEDTRKAIESHFKLINSGGIVVMSFPTPTLLYRVSRKVSEGLGLWMFHDERALEIREVADEVLRYGEILYHGIIWPIFFTQGVILVKKYGVLKRAEP